MINIVKVAIGIVLTSMIMGLPAAFTLSLCKNGLCTPITIVLGILTLIEYFIMVEFFVDEVSE